MQKDLIAGSFRRVNRRESMLIKVNCGLPKRLAGEYMFSSYHELSRWIYNHFSRPRSLPGQVTARLSESGGCSLFTGMYSIETKSDFTLSYLGNAQV